MEIGNERVDDAELEPRGDVEIREALRAKGNARDTIPCSRFRSIWRLKKTVTCCSLQYPDTGCPHGDDASSHHFAAVDLFDGGCIDAAPLAMDLVSLDGRLGDGAEGVQPDVQGYVGQPGSGVPKAEEQVGREMESCSRTAALPGVRA